MSFQNKLHHRLRIAQPILGKCIAWFVLIISIVIAPSIQANELTSPQDVLTLARKARDQEQYDEAIKDYQKVIQMSSDNAIVSIAEMELAWIYAYQKKYSDSLALCDRLVQRNPNSEVLQLQRAKILGWTKRYGDSLQAYQRILTQNPQSFSAQLGQAEVLSWSGRYDEAIKDYQKVIQMSSDNTVVSMAEMELAWIYAYQKKYSDSLALCDRLVQRNPNSEVLQLQRAKILGWTKQYGDSLQAYQQILTQNPQSLPAQLGQAEVLNWLGRYDEAIRVYREVLSHHVDNEEALTGIAQATLWQDDLDNALQQFLHLYQQFPKSIPIQLGLAKTYQARQEIKNALAIIQPLIDNKNPQAIDISQEIHSIQSDTELAIRNRSSNQNNLEINQTIKFRLDDSNTLQSVQLGYAKFTQPGLKQIQITPIRIGIEGTNYPTRWKLRVGADIFDRLATQPFFEGLVTTQISPSFQVGANANYQAYKENNATLENGINVFRLQPFVSWQFTPTTYIYVEYDAGFYSDSNRDGQLSTILRQKLGNFYVEGLIFTWDFAKDLNNGYFSPPDFFLYSGELGWQGRVAESAICNFAISLGRQSYIGQSFSENGYKAGCRLELSTTTTIEAQYLNTSSALFTGGLGNNNEQRFQFNLKTKF